MIIVLGVIAVLLAGILVLLGVYVKRLQPVTPDKTFQDTVIQALKDLGENQYALFNKFVKEEVKPTIAPEIKPEIEPKNGKVPEGTLEAPMVKTEPKAVAVKEKPKLKKRIVKPNKKEAGNG